MAGRPKQPAEVIEKRKLSHMSKAEIEARKNSEIHALADKIAAPEYLTDKQKTEFDIIAEELTTLKIMSNLDCDVLALFIVSRSNYAKFTKLLNSLAATKKNIFMLKDATTLQDRAFKQCRAAASDLGLTISSRCKLVVPQAPQEKPTNKFDKFQEDST